MARWLDVRSAAIAVIVALLSACGGRPVDVRFEGLVGGEPAACGATYEGIGTTNTRLTLLDFRLYVHDLRLVTEDGREIPLALAQDGWQHDDVALLDFEDGTNGCDSGTEATNAVVRGTIPEDAELSGIRFRLGVPFELNHADASTAPAPLNYTAMFWGWNGGYKYLRIDGRTTGLSDGFRAHVGATGCEGDGRGNVTGCLQDNRAEIELTGFDPDENTIAIDIADLFADSDLDADAGGLPGCLGSLDDPDCEPVFHRLGLPFGDAPAPGPQATFSVR